MAASLGSIGSMVVHGKAENRRQRKIRRHEPAGLIYLLRMHPILIFVVEPRAPLTIYRA
jgi:hypothetical protein